MNRKWIVSLIGAATIVLAGCNQTIEEQASAGMLAVETTFEAQSNIANKLIGQIELYMPKGFTIEQGIDASNYTVKNGEAMYILFVNENETSDSQLLHGILLEDKSKKIIEEKTFETDGLFGFSAITEVDEETSELIVSIGGTKLTTISSNKHVDEKLAGMMQIVQSVNVVEQEK